MYSRPVESVMIAPSPDTHTRALRVGGGVMQRVQEMGLVPVERCVAGHAPEVTPSTFAAMPLRWTSRARP